MRSKKELEIAKKKLGSVGALDFLLSRSKKSETWKKSIRPLNYAPFQCKKIELERDLEEYKKPPKTWPKNVALPPIYGSGNDYSYLLKAKPEKKTPRVSVIVLTYNRDAFLEKTLIGLKNQKYPLELIEVIITDDGGSSETLTLVKRFQDAFKVKYCWHPDVGFTPSRARNNAIRMASSDFIVQLDVDMYPDPELISEYASYVDVLDQIVLIGPRKYVDLTNVSPANLSKEKTIIRQVPEVRTNNEVAGRLDGKKSIDWRLHAFQSTNYLRTEHVPFRFFAAGNVAFSKRRFEQIGGYDERFKSWGHEDGELAFRFYQAGLYFKPVMDAWAYHQEPENGQNETDRLSGSQVSGNLYGQICPFYRRLLKERTGPFEVPWVSIYIPAFNAEATICDAIDSALRQTYTDLEVCVCDDGSTDRTGELIERYFGGHKRVKFVRKENGGIGAASNQAISMSRGVFIGQLDSDDYLAQDVVERCFAVFQKKPDVGVVYTSYENQNPDGYIEPGYNYPVYNRYKLMTSMIAHHFRMFRKRDWARVNGFNERITNAVDFDFFLKLSEIAEFHHLNIRGYRRRLHGNNTSTVNFAAQNKNAERAVNDSLRRLGLPLSARLIDPGKPALVFNQRAKSSGPPGRVDLDFRGEKQENASTEPAESAVVDFKRVDELARKAVSFALQGTNEEYRKTVVKAIDYAYAYSLSSKLPLTIRALTKSSRSYSERDCVGVEAVKQRTAVFCSGFGWSGSSAVFDFLREYHPEPAYAFSRSEVKVFWRRGGGFGLPDLLGALGGENGNSERAIRDFVFGSVLGINNGIVKSSHSAKLLNESLINRLVQHKSFSKFDMCIANFIHGLRRASALKADERFGSLRELASRFLQGIMDFQCPDGATHCLFDNGILAADIDVVRWLDRTNVIAVTRDPRDAYVSRKQDGKWNRSVKAFCDDFESKRESFLQSLDLIAKDGSVIVVDFSEFVRDEKKREEIASQISLDSALRTGQGVFVPENSIRNVGLHKKYAIQSEIREIESRLKGLCPLNA